MKAEKEESKKHHKEGPHTKAPSDKPSRSEREIEELKDKYYRALADLDNFKKRAASEKEEIISFANTALIAALLPITDSFERALGSAESSGAGEDIVKGIALIKKQLEDVLEKAGVTIIHDLGKPFDPSVHEAILKRSSDSEDGTILEVAQKGYKLHGRVIRPAMVVISERKDENG